MEEEDEHDVLYGDIVTRHGDDGTESMRIAFDQMQKREVTHLRRIETLEDRVRDVEEENARLKKENETITKRKQNENTSATKRKGNKNEKSQHINEAFEFDSNSEALWSLALRISSSFS